MSVNEKMTAIADAIRAKTGGTTALTLDQMATEISGIQTGSAPVLTELSITENGEYTPNEGIDGFSKVTVAVESTGGGGSSDTLKAVLDRSITEINDDSITSLGGNAFHGCGKLTIVNLPNLQSIRDAAFRNCSSLKSMVFPSLTAYNGEGNGIFSGCSALTTVDFHLSVSFSQYAFFGAKALTALILRGSTVCSLGGTGANAVGTKIADGTGYIYVPGALVDSYKAATNWSTYANQFRALEDYTVDGTTTGELDTTKI